MQIGERGRSQIGTGRGLVIHPRNIADMPPCRVSCAWCGQVMPRLVGPIGVAAYCLACSAQLVP